MLNFSSCAVTSIHSLSVLIMGDPELLGLAQQVNSHDKIFTVSEFSLS